jgi:Zn-dependent M28 family amino/carboxypeptidase
MSMGKDWVPLSIGSAEIKGKLKIAGPAEKAAAGDIVLFTPGDEDTLREIQPRIDEFIKDGAAAVLIVETKELRQRWADLAERRPSLSRAGTLIAVSKEAANALSAQASNELAIHAEFSEPERTFTWNALGKIAGTDPALSSQVILISSHLDHLGVRPGVPGDDKIFNGADDDASGTVAVLEIARALAAGRRPKRTVYFVCFGSEEAGGRGAGYFVNNLPFPKEELVANLEFEMIGRPDAKVKPEELWLTGYERSNLGPELAKRGAKLVQDPHPEQNFFRRSDNYTLARQGIIAHTVSSFGLHTDYHKASDEVSTIDIAHMTRSINAMVEPVRWLANSAFVPSWNEGMKP